MTKFHVRLPGSNCFLVTTVFIICTRSLEGNERLSLADSPHCLYDAPRPYYYASCENVTVPHDLDFTGLPDRLTRLILINLTIHHNYSAISPGPTYADPQRNRKMTVHFSSLRYVGGHGEGSNSTLPFHAILKQIASVITSLTIENSYIGHLHEHSLEGFIILTELRLIKCGITSLHPHSFYPLARSNRPAWLSMSLLQPGARSVLQRLDLRRNRLAKFEWESLRPVAHSIEVICLDNNEISRLSHPVHGAMTMPALFYVSVAGNKMTTLPIGILNALESGAYIVATNNAFSCDARELSPFFQWIKHNPGIRVENFTCVDVKGSRKHPLSLRDLQETVAVEDQHERHHSVFKMAAVGRGATGKAAGPGEAFKRRFVVTGFLFLWSQID